MITELNGGKVVIYQGDCRNVLAMLPDESVQSVVTSPPYYGLRDYGTARWIGGDEGCGHVDEEAKAERMRQKKSMIKCGEQTDGSTRTRVHDETIGKQWQYRGTCDKCGATRTDSQIGLEETPDDYITSMVEVFREVRRVLREDGTLWLNMGDSYLQNKNLLGIPWRLALALQADGWWLRQDIIWHKNNPMPESVTDRCTKSHEYIFLMTKAASYYYDAEAIKEPAKWERWGNQTEKKDHTGTAGHLGGKTLDQLPIKDKKNKRSVWSVNTTGFPGAHFAVFPTKLIEPCIKAGCKEGDTVLDPFMGSGTTGEVAINHSCKFIGIELNEDYIKLAVNRLKQSTLF